LSAWEEKIRRCWSGPIRWDCRLAPFTTLKVGGPADALIEPTDRQALAGLVGRLTAEEVPWWVLGRGSNLVIADRGVEGVVILLGRHFATIEFEETASGPQLTVEAGCSLARLLAWCCAEGLSGLEFATGIPGGVGGAIMMNAGAWGNEISGVLREVILLDAQGGLETRPLQATNFCYRGWRHPHGKIVVAGRFALGYDTPKAIAARCHQLAKQRAAKQPKGVASAGSFFKNPPGDAAGRLIEQAGLKGLRVGDAEVSTVHANFLVNRGQASAHELRALMGLVQDRVAKQFGVELLPEVHFVGRWGNESP